jgi:CRP-like cAMP-binding protein
MRNETLFEVLTGTDPKIPMMEKAVILSRNGKIQFLSAGHAAECYPIKGGKRIVSLFYGPKEFLIPSHPSLSEIIALDDAHLTSIPIDAMEEARTKYPEVQIYYHHIESEYRRKVDERIRSLKHMTAEERFGHLKATQPWVLEIVPEEDIAAYLQISAAMLKQLLRG